MKRERCIAGDNKRSVSKRDIYRDIYRRVVKYIGHKIFYIISILVIWVFMIEISGFIYLSVLTIIKDDKIDNNIIGYIIAFIIGSGILTLIITSSLNKLDKFKDKHETHIKDDIYRPIKGLFHNNLFEIYNPL
jgi:hypothetical protein